MPKTLTDAKRLWDEEAARWGEMREVTIAENAFLQRLKHLNVLKPYARVLDVGCGAGRFTVAVARFCQEAVGIDLSPAMIEKANERAQKNGIENIRFVCEAWQSADLKSLGFENGFDTVFAHMTDAVNDAATARKMTQASKSLCILEMWQERKNPALESAFSAAAYPEALDHKAALQAIEDYLKAAHLPYEKFVRVEKKPFKKTVDEALTFCTLRVPQALLTESVVLKMQEALRSYAKEDVIDLETEEKVLTLIWRVENVR